MGRTKQQLDRNQEEHKDMKGNGETLPISQLNEWLENNYELKEGACIPRCLIYAHYLEYCRNCSAEPLGSAIFGKVIRTQFKTLTTRRLGTRGQSKYHYYGLGVKTSRVCAIRNAGNTRLTRFTESSVYSKVSKPNSQRNTMIDSVFDDFAKVKNRLSEEGRYLLAQEKINSFLIIYEAHCQRILDTVVAANFDDVESSLLHFWCSMPNHVSEILQEKTIPDIVVACDTILYKKINDIIIPSSVQDIPGSFRTELTKFVKCFLPWLDICLINIPKELADAKMKVAKTYVKLINRQLAFLSFAQPVKAILSDCQQTRGIVQDLEKVKFIEILRMKSKRMIGSEKFCAENLEKFFKDVVDLFRRKAPVDFFLFVIDEFINDVLIQPYEKSHADIKLANKDFLLDLSQILSKLMRDLTLRSAKTCGSIHIITSMIIEYIFLALESKIIKDQEIIVFSGFNKAASQERANKRSADGSDYQEPAPKLSRVPDNCHRPPKSYTAFVGHHDSQSTQSEKLDAAQENSGQLYSLPDDSHCMPVIEYPSPCPVGKQGIHDNSLNWMSTLPSFQDLVVSNNWADLQGNEPIYQKDQKLLINDHFDNASRFVSFY